MKKICFLLLLSWLVMSGCENINLSEKQACEKSGGEYDSGFSETLGVFYYCKCPPKKYETREKICADITQVEIDKCVQLSNNFVKCENEGGTCQCTFEASGATTYLTYQQLNDCSCQCNQDACLCGPCQAKK